MEKARKNYHVLEEHKNTNFYEELKKYFDETPQEKIQEDWGKSKHLDNVGPTVNDFMQQYCKCGIKKFQGGSFSCQRTDCDMSIHVKIIGRCEQCGSNLTSDHKCGVNPLIEGLITDLDNTTVVTLQEWINKKTKLSDNTKNFKYYKYCIVRKTEKDTHWTKYKKYRELEFAEQGLKDIKENKSYTYDFSDIPNGLNRKQRIEFMNNLSLEDNKLYYEYKIVPYFDGYRYEE
jgi:hypothetical protein